LIWISHEILDTILKIRIMIVERQNNEIIVRFKAGIKASKIQPILDYLKYEELTLNSDADNNDVDRLLKKIKKGRWERIQKEIGWDD